MGEKQKGVRKNDTDSERWCRMTCYTTFRTKAGHRVSHLITIYATQQSHGIKNEPACRLLGTNFRDPGNGGVRTIGSSNGLGSAPGGVECCWIA